MLILSVAMRRIVVTGATSMIGVSLINAALNEDQELEKVYAVSRPESEKTNRLPVDDRIKLVACDIAEYDSLSSLINDKCDCFFHLAWPRTATYDESISDITDKCGNLNAVLQAVSAAKALGCKKFVGAGGQSEYGVSNGSLSPDSPCFPVRADGIIKLAAGQLSRLCCEKAGLDWIWMRVFSAYGKYDRMNSMVMSTISKLKKGEHCSFTSCGQMWEYTNADDIGRGFYLAGEKAEGSKIYCVGLGQAKPLREYIETIRDIVAPEAELGFGEIPYPENPVMYLCADNRSLMKDTGWKPQISFEDGIREINREFENL